MVPGLRNVPMGAGRREYYGEQLDELQYGGQRLPQGRGVEQLLPNQLQGLGPQVRGGVNPMHMQQQAMYGRGPSPGQLGGQPRMPAGLANLGSRPPHDPSQFIGLPGQQPYGGLGGAGAGFGGHPQMRGPPPQMQSGPGGPGGLDPRTNQAQLLALGGGGGMALNGSMPGRGGFGLQQPQAQMHGGGFGGRPMQPAPPYAAQMGMGGGPGPGPGAGMLPPHMQPQPAPQAPSSADAQNLMALLMGGRRE
jgi:hypothetical protein